MPPRSSDIGRLACACAWAHALNAGCAATPATRAAPDALEADAGPDAADAADAADVVNGDSEAVAPAFDAGPSGAAPCSALPLCEGFESFPAGPLASGDARWSVAHPDCSGAGTLSIDAAIVHGGARSLRVDGGGGYCDHVFLASAGVVPAVGPDVYVRFFLRVSAPLGPGHVTFLAMKDGADQGGDLRMGGQDSILMYNRQSDDATLPVLSPTGTGLSVALRANAWTCVEIHVGEAAGTIETWVDGSAVPGLVEDGSPVADVSTQWLAHPWKPALGDLRLGWESYSGQNMTVWFDDVAVAAQRVGCGR